MSYWRYNSKTGRIEELPNIPSDIGTAGAIDEENVSSANEIGVEYEREWSEEHQL